MAKGLDESATLLFAVLITIPVALFASCGGETVSVYIRFFKMYPTYEKIIRANAVKGPWKETEFYRDTFGMVTAESDTWIYDDPTDARKQSVGDVPGSNRADTITTHLWSHYYLVEDLDD